MARRVFIFFLFVTAAFFGALAVADRVRTSGEPAASATVATQPSGVGPAAQRATAAPPLSGGLPDLTEVAKRAVGSVTNISSTQIVRTSNSPFANDPFFRHFFGDRGRRVRVSRPARAEPGIRCDRLAGRLCAHEQPRDRQYPRGGDRRALGQARAAREDHRHRRGDRHRAAEDPGQQPADAAVGGFLEAEGRRVGPRDRQSLPAQSDGHPRHRLGDGAQPRRPAGAVPRTSSRRTRPSTPETQAAR